MKPILTYILLCLIFQIDCFSQTDITKKSLENISFKEYHGEIADARNKEGLAFANISLLNSKKIPGREMPGMSRFNCYLPITKNLLFILSFYIFNNSVDSYSSVVVNLVFFTYTIVVTTSF